VDGLQVQPLSPSPDTCEQLSEILVDVVAAGGSVSFMHPLDQGAARAFWPTRWERRPGPSASCSVGGTARSWRAR
jgi:hypothetical protein